MTQVLNLLNALSETALNKFRVNVRVVTYTLIPQKPKSFTGGMGFLLQVINKYSYSLRWGKHAEIEFKTSTIKNTL